LINKVKKSRQVKQASRAASTGTKQKPAEELRGQTSALASSWSQLFSRQGTQPPVLDYMMSTSTEE